MTLLSNFSGALHLMLGLTALWFLIFRLVHEYRLDVLRDQLFAVRERLFDYAANGNIAFDNAAYTQLRMLLNSLIRFGYRLTFTRFLMGVIFMEWKDKPYDRELLIRWEKAVAELPPESQVELKSIRGEALVLVVRHLVTGSPVMLILLVVFAIGSLLRGLTEQLLEAFTKELPGLEILQIQVMEADAEERHPERALAHQ
jgi:hypothetical protein